MPVIESKEAIKINNVEFTAIEGINYSYDYVKAARAIANGEIDQLSTYRAFIKQDLFFILYFVMGIKAANHDFVVSKCQEVENGPQTMTLDVWARGHFKSTIITVAETVQYHLENPEHCTCIFSYKKPAAGKFLDAIRKTYENELMKACFPDLLFDNPESQSPSWSLENGITIKRKGKSRPQKTVQASGLLEGMVTGDHFDRLIWDDVETDDIADQPDQLRKCGNKFDMSQNLGMVGGVTLKRVIGTFYSHAGVVVKIRDKKDIHGNSLFESRIVPATHDGTPNGDPVLLTQKELDEKKTESSYNTQQLCDPTPVGIKKLDGALLQDIEPEDIPSNIHKLMLVDPAGDDPTSKSNDNDPWGMMVVGVDPNFDDVGASNIYITDLLIDKLGEVEGIEQAVRMYLSNGVIFQLGVEKVGLSTTEIHIANALKVHRRKVSIEDKTLYLCKPAGRNKHRRIESGISWPLYNGKIFMSTAIPKRYRDRIREEMDEFPYGAHEEGCDLLSYVYDMIHDKDNKYRLLSSPRPKRHLRVVPKYNKETAGTAWMGA